MSELKLEVGKVYKARNGSIRLVTDYFPCAGKFAYFCGDHSYSSNGKYMEDDENEFDLIEEYKTEEKEEEEEINWPEAAESFAKWICTRDKKRASIIMDLINKYYKEEEPKFKVGDEVVILNTRQKGKIVFIDENIYCSPVRPILIVYKAKESLTADWFNKKDIIDKVESE